MLSSCLTIIILGKLSYLVTAVFAVHLVVFRLKYFSLEDDYRAFAVMIIILLFSWNASYISMVVVG